MTTLQEKENEIRKKMRQLREEIRIYMKIYKEMELEVDRISLDEAPKEKMKGQQKDAESPSFPFSIESEDVDQWAERENLTPETLRVLKEEGFDSLEKLSELTSADIDTLFVNTNLLKKQQCLRLKRAVETLNIESSQGQADSGHVASSAARQRRTWQSEGETLTFLMVGKTGTGKSTTGNTILGGDFFQASASFTSVTTVCELKRATRNGVTIEVMDCPGLFDTSKSHDSIATTVVRAVGGMHPGPHAVLLIVRIGRFTEEEEHSYTRLMALFDERLAKYTIVVFTGGDAIRPSDSFEEMIAANRYLQSIVTACDYRYVIFNNMASDKEPQVDILLKKVRELVAKNGGQPYTCPKYFRIAEVIEEEVKKRMKNVEIEILKKTKYVKELEKRAKQTKEDLEREKKESKERERIRKQMEQEELMKKQIENRMRDWSIRMRRQDDRN